MKSQVQKRKTEVGGLHKSLAVGEFLDIVYNNESLRIIMIGKNGVDSFCISLVGPKSFKIFSSTNQDRQKAGGR